MVHKDYVKRTFIDKNNNKYIIILERVQCKHCKKVLRVLPIFLFPYKRHIVEVVTEAVTSAKKNTCVAVEESTLNLWRIWWGLVLGLLKPKIRLLPSEDQKLLDLSTPKEYVSKTMKWFPECYGFG